MSEARLKEIHDFAAANHETNPERVTELLAEAVEISRAMGDMPMLLRSLWRRAIGLRTLLRLNEALDTLNEALQIAEKFGTQNDVGGLYETLGLTYYQYGSYKESKECHRKSGSTFLKIGSVERYVKALADEASILVYEGNLAHALELCNEGFTMCKERGINVPIQLYHNSGMVFNEIGEFSKALDYDFSALKLAEADGQYNFQATILSSIAIAYKRQGETKLASEYSARALALHNKFYHPSSKVNILVNSVDVLLLLGMEEKAAEHIREAYRIIDDHQLIPKRQLVLYADAMLQKARGNVKRMHELLDAALLLSESILEQRVRLKIYLEKACISEGKEREVMLMLGVEDALKSGSKDILPDFYYALFEYYEQIGNFASALYFHKLFHSAKEAVSGEKSQRHFQVLQVQFEAERKQKEAQILRLENEKLAQSIEHNKEQLTSLTLYLTQKNQILMSIQKSAAEAIKGGGQKYQLRQILRLSAENNESFWQQFENRFKSVYGDFYERLLRQYPDLTTMEARVCILTRTGIPNKEIADLLTLSNRTIESHRSSIRKKLGLERSANLSSHLSSL